MYKPESKRQRYEILRSQLEQERSTFIPLWRELSDYILPSRSRFLITDANKGHRRNQKIVDSRGCIAARTLRSGMMAGITSPARPWFRLTTPDPDLAEFSSAKEWLHLVSRRMNGVFLKSNLYNTLDPFYGDLGVFGTAPISVEESFSTVIHCNSFPIGSYALAKGQDGRVNVFFREFRMTVRNLISFFGRRLPSGQPDWSNFSIHVRMLYEQGQMEAWVDVCHVIEPNPEFDERKLQSKHKKFSSCYYERGSSSASTSGYLQAATDQDKVLRESGYDIFPILGGRWETTGEDVYATDCPGITALGDIKALQLMQRRKAQAVEKMVNPPMTGPTSLRTAKVSILPGDITYADVREGMQGFRPAHEVNPRIQELLLDIQDHHQRIDQAFFADLFLMLHNSDRRDITAREIDERHEEKLLALGPVLENMNQDILDPLIDLTFDIMSRQGLIPPPPEELQGMDLKVEYVSMMAQAQKLIGVSSIERFAGFVGQLASVTGDPSVFDKVDRDQMIDDYGDAVGVSPKIVRSDDKVEEIRAGRAREAAQAAQVEQVSQAAVAAKNLSQTDMGSDSALSRLIDQSQAGQLVEGA